MAAVQPFQFEPERNINDRDNLNEIDQENEDDGQGDEEEARVGQNRWCQCGNCVPMPTER